MKKLIVITGASSGFGLEMAKLFNDDKYHLLLLSRNIEGLCKMEFKSAMIKSVDVSDYDAFNSAVTSAVEVYGDVDLLINNAGVMLLGNVEDQAPSEWQTMLDTNVVGVLNGIQIVSPMMKKNNSGTIINISSIAGQKAFANHAAYCASKFAVHGLTETVRQELSSFNVRVLLVSPGASETNLLSHTTSQAIKDGYNQWKTIMDDDKSLDPYYIALATKFMYEVPQDVSIRELTIADTKQDA